MRWLELAARVDAEAVEAVGEVFTRVAVNGIAVEPDLLPGADDGYLVGTEATVRGYIPLDGQSASKTRQIEEALWYLRAIWPVGELTTREIAEADWANAWKAHFSTFRAGRRVVIQPSWLTYTPEDGDVVVSLDPGAAFGTGLHPTTRRCLLLLEDVVRPGDTVFDVGTGSGILALAARGLGAREVVAVDVDPIAISVAQENVLLNRAESIIAVGAGSADAPPPDRQFDVVVANIIARILTELAPALAARVRPGGALIAAGIIAERSDDVVKAFAREGLTVDRYVDGDWVSLLARHSTKPPLAG
jgi:ribosomal protein L11 methyltransferase